ncbi:MAG: formate dehydrogenase family accessory protein FdhD [Bacilli bacterium]|nr:formate dehydrogenase family accessory protein FdhD [Bacilli bacterium]
MDKLNQGVIVLAGGKSSRMGVDKWMLPIGDHPVLELIVQKLEPICTEMWIVAASAEALTDPRRIPDFSTKYPNVKYTQDQTGELGPLGGIVSGFAHCNCPYILVTASDLPFPSAQLANALFALCKDNQVDAAIPEQDGRLHPLFGVYRQETAHKLTEYMAKGGRKVMDWLHELNFAVLSETQVTSIDPQGIALFNMNHPDNYVKANVIYSKLIQPSE